MQCQGQPVTSLSGSTDKLIAAMVNTRSNSGSNQEEYNMSVDEKLNLLIDEVRRIKVGNEQCLSEITQIKEDVTKIKNDFTASVDMCFSKIKDCETSVGGNSKKIAECETLIDSLRSENIALKESVVALKRRVAVGEQYSRSNCLEITGVPEARNENICEVVKRVAKAVNFNLENVMIDAAHRLAKNPNKPESPRGIIVKFCRRVDMEELRQRAKVKRWINAADLGYQSDRKIFINLSLSRESRILWNEVRKFKDDNKYKFAWITNSGKIFLRKMEGHAPVLVSEVSDLDRLK